MYITGLLITVIIFLSVIVAVAMPKDRSRETLGKSLHHIDDGDYPLPTEPKKEETIETDNDTKNEKKKGETEVIYKEKLPNGTLVKHKQFGIGKVLKTKEDGLITVEFRYKTANFIYPDALKDGYLTVVEAGNYEVTPPNPLKKCWATGDVFQYESNAEFLNDILGTHYKAFMKASYTVRENISIIWFGSIDCKERNGWINEIIDKNTISERYIGSMLAKPANFELGLKTPYRAIFNKYKPPYGYNQYTFLGVYKYCKEESTADGSVRIWKKVLDTADISTLKRL